MIINMHDKIKSCVFIFGNKSEHFSNFKWVLEWESLSPLLFSLCLNDLED